MSRWRGLALLSSLPIAAGTVLTRGYPRTSFDAGIFLSVAGRLVADDRLYRDVFDNKDPLFYFSQALALWAFGWRGPFLLDIGWLLLASIGSHLLVRALTGNFAIAVFAQVAYPLLLTGLYYNAGYSETPGLSLLPLLAYLVYQRRPSLAGCVAAAVLFLKANLVPVVAAIGLVGLVFPAEGGPPLARSEPAGFRGNYGRRCLIAVSRSRRARRGGSLRSDASGKCDLRVICLEGPTPTGRFPRPSRRRPTQHAPTGMGHRPRAGSLGHQRRGRRRIWAKPTLALAADGPHRRRIGRDNRHVDRDRALGSSP